MHYPRQNDIRLVSCRSKLSTVDHRLPTSKICKLKFYTKIAPISGVFGQTTHFYGNSGVCVFKYLVSQEDPQKWYSISILAVNSICMVLISVSYLTVGIKATVSRRKSNTVSNAACKEHNDKRDRRMQLKISAIIITDMIAWLPFTIVCFLHFGNVIDATSWYPIFSVIAIPINSVVNPLLYGAETFKAFITAPLKRIRGSVALGISQSSKSERQPLKAAGSLLEEQQFTSGRSVIPIISSSALGGDVRGASKETLRQSRCKGEEIELKNMVG